jgi:hypothetical protein
MAYDGKWSEKIEDKIHDTDYIVFYSIHTHVQQNLLYLYSFVYSLCDDGYVEAETCRGGIINGKWFFISDCAVCWFKLSIFNLQHWIWIPIKYVKILSDLKSLVTTNFPHCRACCSWQHLTAIYLSSYVKHISRVLIHEQHHYHLLLFESNTVSLLDWGQMTKWEKYAEGC